MALLYDYTKKVNPYESLLANPTNQSGGLISQPATAKAQTEKTTSLTASPTAQPIQAPAKPATLTAAPKVPETLDTAMAKAVAEPEKITEKPITDPTKYVWGGAVTEANKADYDKFASSVVTEAEMESKRKEYEATQQPGYVKPITPITELSADEKAAFDLALKEQTDNYTRQADDKIKEIRTTGEKTQTSARSLLAKFGALGTTLTGAPVETGLGAASAIKNRIDAAVREEEANRDALISAAKTKSAEAVQLKIDKLNELQQQNYDNALKLAEQDKERYQVSGTGIFDTQTGTWKVEPTDKDQEKKVIGTEKTGYYEYDPETGKTTQLISPTTPEEDQPSSYKEWKLAGGESGTGQSYGNWLKKTGKTATDTTEITPEKIESVNRTVGLIDEMLAHPGLPGAVGYQGIIRTRLPESQEAQFAQLATAMKSMLQLENMGVMKGVLSDSDMKVIAAASTELQDLSAWDMANYKKKLEEIKTRLQERLNTPAYKTETETSAEDDPLGILGFNQGGGGNKPTAMRTDRNNNPTAFTTDVAKTAGLKEGVDYVKGDTFSGGKYATAKLLGDPIDTTIKVIDNIGFQTASGKPRWSYINMSKSEWDKMNYNQKKQVIATMYQNEGGSQLRSLFA